MSLETLDVDSTDSYATLALCPTNRACHISIAMLPSPKCATVVDLLFPKRVVVPSIVPQPEPFRREICA
jgi:hypothetical protein